MERRDIVSFHESGHLVVGVALGRFQNGAVAEVLDTGGYRGLTSIWPRQPSCEEDHPTFDEFASKLQSDLRRAADFGKLMFRSRGWLKGLRSLWLQTDSILERNWLAVKMVAFELHDQGVIRRDRCQQILDRWMGIPSESILEALGLQASCHCSLS